MKLSEALATRGRDIILHGMTDPAYSVLVKALDGEFDAAKQPAPAKKVKPVSDDE